MIAAVSGFELGLIRAVDRVRNAVGYPRRRKELTWKLPVGSYARNGETARR